MAKVTEARAVEVQCHDKDGDATDETAWGDANDRELDPVRVRQVREAEMSFFKRTHVYEEVSRHTCRDMTGREPIKARWVDTNTQDEANPKYRIRLVAKDYKTRSEPELCTATPPIDALRLLLSLASSGCTSRGARRRVMINDVVRAYFNAPSLPPKFVEIC